MSTFLFLFVLLVVLVGVNVAVYFLARRDVGRRVWGGLLILFLAPVVWLGTFFGADMVDSPTWGAGYVTYVFTMTVVLNGLLVFFSGVFQRRRVRARDEQRPTV